MRKFHKNDYLYIFLIILVAFFLRSYNFEKWFYFQSDQKRDINNSLQVIDNGFGELSLLGPKGGGTDVHLGPIYYYLQPLGPLKPLG